MLRRLLTGALAATMFAGCDDPTPPDSEGMAAEPLFAAKPGAGPKTGGFIVTDLGTFPGANPNRSRAFGINDAGYVTGDSWNDQGVSHAFLWTPTTPNATTGSLQDLGTLGGPHSTAFAINNSGQIAGAAHVASGAIHAALWTPSGSIVDLGTLAGGYTQAEGINATGQVTGWSVVGGASHAFLWKPNVENGTTGTMVDLNTSEMVDPNTSDAEVFEVVESQGRKINATGQVVGTFTYVKRNVDTNVEQLVEDHAFLWTPDEDNGTTGKFQDLGTLPGHDMSDAWGVNDKGVVVGRSRTTSGLPRAFVWTPLVAKGTTGTMVNLGTLGGKRSEAYAINNKRIEDKGQIAGTATGKAGHLRLVLWTLQTDGTYAIQDLGGVENLPVNIGSGGKLQLAGVKGAYSALWTQP
jgi:probable HAF family extracellular repeat protein